VQELTDLGARGGRKRCDDGDGAEANTQTSVCERASPAGDLVSLREGVGQGRRRAESRAMERERCLARMKRASVRAWWEFLVGVSGIGRVPGSGTQCIMQNI
jgi:hypothetical protein